MVFLWGWGASYKTGQRLDARERGEGGVKVDVRDTGKGQSENFSFWMGGGVRVCSQKVRQMISSFPSPKKKKKEVGGAEDQTFVEQKSE